MLTTATNRFFNKLFSQSAKTAVRYDLYLRALGPKLPCLEFKKISFPFKSIVIEICLERKTSSWTPVYLS